MINYIKFLSNRPYPKEGFILLKDI